MDTEDDTRPMRNPGGAVEQQVKHLAALRARLAHIETEVKAFESIGHEHGGMRRVRREVDALRWVIVHVERALNIAPSLATPTEDALRAKVRELEADILVLRALCEGALDEHFDTLGDRSCDCDTSQPDEVSLCETAKKLYAAVHR